MQYMTLSVARLLLPLDLIAILERSMPSDARVPVQNLQNWRQMEFGEASRRRRCCETSETMYGLSRRPQKRLQHGQSPNPALSPLHFYRAIPFPKYPPSFSLAPSPWPSPLRALPGPASLRLRHLNLNLGRCKHGAAAPGCVSESSTASTLVRDVRRAAILHKGHRDLLHKDTDCNRAACPRIPLKKAVRISKSNINVNTMAYREFAHQ